MPSKLISGRPWDSRCHANLSLLSISTTPNGYLAQIPSTGEREQNWKKYWYTQMQNAYMESESERDRERLSRGEF